jgi:hypothetical protein
MNSLEALIIIVFAPLFVDMVCLSSHLWLSKEHKKSAGLIRLLLLSLSQNKKAYNYNKSMLLKLCVLNVAIIIIVFFGFLLTTKINNRENIFSILCLTPIFIMPFLYLIYDLIEFDSVTAPQIISNLRIRGVISLVLCSNATLVSFNHEHNIAPFIGHILLAFSGLLGLFYILTRDENIYYKFNAMPNQIIEFLDLKILKRLTLLAELSYSIFIFYVFYLQNIMEPRLHFFSTFGLISLFFIMMVAMMATIVKIFYPYLENALSLYESIILPASFMLFGITKIIM